jgi:hypothetical protein
MPTQATEVERLRSTAVLVRGVSPVWARRASMRPGRYWMFLSRFLMVAVSWSTSLAARLPGPFSFCLASSTALRSGA